MERETGLEPATFSLARRRSTTELLPPAPEDLFGLRTVLHYKEMPAKKKAPGSPGLCIHSPKQDYQPYVWRKKNHQMSRAGRSTRPFALTLLKQDCQPLRLAEEEVPDDQSCDDPPEPVQCLLPPSCIFRPSPSLCPYGILHRPCGARLVKGHR